MEYKQTLNMNKSGFPMRGGLPMREPDMLKHWQELDLYNELLKKNEGKPRFALHDGPPFSNGALHMGHALNKCIKDFMIRSAAMRGYYTPYIPGWDNHGMPIESAIIKKNKLNHKAMPIPEFRSACHDFAQHYIDVQMEGFKRLGVVADWEHPYKTMAPSFEAEEVKVFGAMIPAPRSMSSSPCTTIRASSRTRRRRTSRSSSGRPRSGHCPATSPSR